MNEKTQKLTTGAMFTAIFAIILLVNRQTGGMFEEFVMYLLPIPMVGYASKYGLKSGIPVVIAMGLISIIVSTPTAIFYAVTEAVIGLILGSAVYAKRDMTKTMVVVMGLSAVVNVLNTIVLASLFGYDIDGEIGGMQSMMAEMFAKSGAPQEAIEAMQMIMTPAFLFKMLVVSMAIMGIIQGFIVYQLSLLILRRLKFYVPKPKSMYTIRPPFWSGALCAVMFFIHNMLLAQEIKGTFYSVFEVLAICAYVYLIWFGILCVMLLCRKYVTRNKIVGLIIAILIVLMFPMLEMMLGLFYMSPNYYNKLVEGMGLEVTESDA